MRTTEIADTISNSTASIEGIPLSLKYITQTTGSGEPSSRNAQVRFRLKI